MRAPLWERIVSWLCEKTGHLGKDAGWDYNGQHHSNCRICGAIVSEDLKHD